MDISGTLIAFIVVGLIIVYAIMVYNKLVDLKNRGVNSFAQIEVQLKRRYDLIPNLVNTAKGYLQHERETLEAVIAARDSASKLLGEFSGNLGNVAAASAFTAAEGTLGNLLSGLRVTMEAYPDLKASTNMAQLTEELTNTENMVGFSRQAYNDMVQEYNTYKQSFPQLLFAGIFGHRDDMNMLEFADSEQIKQAPEVKF